MTKHFCIECSQELHTAVQECGPYVRNERGELVGQGRMVIMECVNAKCDLFMVTASLENYPTTTANYLRFKRQSNAPAHA